jgi:superfamily I DNA/RNA helicase
VEQENIFEFIKVGRENGIIDAVAGAGKTFTILECARYIPKNAQAMFCAFNKSIATEIGDKLHRISKGNVSAKTIHALGWRIIRERFSREPKLDDSKYYRLLIDPRMQESLSSYYEAIFRINKKLTDRDKTDYKYVIDEYLLDIINKGRLTIVKMPEAIDVTEFQNMVDHYDCLGEYEDKELPEYYKMFSVLLERGNDLFRETKIMDFTDMLYLPCIWELYPKGTYDFLFIDECQDLSLAQLLITKKYVHMKSRIVAVGDPFQAINGFAGADADSFNRVKTDFSAKILPLTKCFRCPEEVIELAKAIRSDITGLDKQGLVQTIEYRKVLEMAKPGDLIVSRTKDSIIPLMFAFIDTGMSVHSQCVIVEYKPCKIRRSIRFQRRKQTNHISGDFEVHLLHGNTPMKSLPSIVRPCGKLRGDFATASTVPRTDEI